MALTDLTRTAQPAAVPLHNLFNAQDPMPDPRATSSCPSNAAAGLVTSLPHPSLAQPLG